MVGWGQLGEKLVCHGKSCPHNILSCWPGPQYRPSPFLGLFNILKREQSQGGREDEAGQCPCGQLCRHDWGLQT